MVTGCQENESCSIVLNFLERLDYRVGVPIRRLLQQSSRERVQEVTRGMAASLVRNLRIEVTDAFELEIRRASSWTVLSRE